MFIELGNLSNAASTVDCGLEVSERPGVGQCVLASVRFAKGEVLDSFSGEIGPDICQHSLQVGPGLHISDTRFVGFLAHGCDPNCCLDMERFELIALRDIASGELLTVDYAATEDVLFQQFACNCAASACRGWITGRTEDVNERERGATAGERKPMQP